MEENIKIDEEYKKAFNLGYELAKELNLKTPMFKSVVPTDDHMNAVQAGMMQYSNELNKNLHKGNDTESLLKELQQKAINNENIFEALMDVCKVCSLGEITSALFEVGGQYRRNM